MDLKSSMDQLFEDRQTRVKSKELEKQRADHAIQVQRNDAITLINTIVEPVLKDFARDITARGFDANVSINKESMAPSASMSFLIPSSCRSVTWPASEITFTISGNIGLSWTVWGAAGKRGLPSGAPKSRRNEDANRQWFEDQVLQFTKAVLSQV